MHLPSLRFLLHAFLALALLANLPACGGDDVSPMARHGGDTGGLDQGGLPQDAATAFGEDMALAGLDAAAFRDAARPEDMPRRDGSVSPFDFGQSEADMPFGADGSMVPDMTLPLRLDAITPTRGGIEGGDDFVLEGQGFGALTKVFFGGQEVGVNLIAGRLAGETPAGLGPGSVTIKAFDPQTGQDLLIDGFTYLSPLRITQVIPPKAPLKGGPSVEIFGQGFDADVRVSFGGQAALSHEVLSGDRLRAVVPPGQVAGAVDVRVTGRDGSDTLPGGLVYVEGLELERVVPSAGSQSGGEQVVIQGSGFVPGMGVEFGGVSATGIQTLDAMTLQVTTPASSTPGLVPVRLSRPDGEAVIVANAFYYGDQTTPVLAAITPALGPVSGGNEVEILGVNLGAVAVKFGQNEAVILDQQDTRIRLIVPAGALGTVDVVATEPGGVSTLSAGYLYVEDLLLESLTPAQGAAAGGTPVVLQGHGFLGVNQVEFGQVPVQSFTVDSDTQITVITPVHAPGVVDVRLERGQVDAVSKGAFVFEEGLEVFGISPIKGSLAGGTVVEVRGRGFVSGMRVEFDGVQALDTQVLDPQTVVVRSPPASKVGPVSVEVEAQAGARAVSPQSFLYFDPGTRFGGASGGRIKGAVNVAVYSRGGAPIRNAFVMLSTRPDTAYQGWTNDVGLITFSGPDVFGEQTVSAVAAAHSGVSVQRVDAENITIFLNRLAPSIPDTGPIGTTTTNSTNNTNTTGTSQGGSNNSSTTPTITMPSMTMNSNTSGNGTSGTGNTSPNNTSTKNTTGARTTNRPTSPPIPPVPPEATYTGQLTGLNKLAITKTDERLVAYIVTTRTSTRSQNPPSGPGNELFADGGYRIITRTGDLALIAVGGVLNTRTQAFRPIKMGVARYLFAVGGKTYTEDITLDIPLDQSLTIKLQDPPTSGMGETYTYGAKAWLDFGFEGISGILPGATGQSSQLPITTLPKLLGKMQGVSLFVSAGAYNAMSFPFSESYKRSVQFSQGVLNMPMASVVGQVSPSDGFPSNGGLYTYQFENPGAAPDLMYVLVIDSLGRAVWEVFLPGDATSFRMPQFPDFSGVRAPIRPTPYKNSAYDMLFYGIKKQGLTIRSYNTTSLARENWDGYSFWRQLVIL